MVAVDQDQIRVWAARLAAPVAFFLAATVLIVLVQRALSAEESASETTPSTVPTTPTGTGATGTNPQPAKKRFYRVRAGDTLESIAARFDTQVEALLELNPAIDDPLALQRGQRIRIR